MGYQHVPNLYKDQALLLFRECYALEKLHGDPGRLLCADGVVRFTDNAFDELLGVAGSGDAALVAAHRDLQARCALVGHPTFQVHGELHGGAHQGQAWRYGEVARFAAFEVRVGEAWLAVPEAESFARKLGLPFVHYRRVSTDLADLDAERDAPSEQAKRNGMVGDQPREGVVLRPLQELVRPDGTRLMAKHKRDEERETATPRPVVDPAQARVLEDAQAIAREWVTATRLEHVLQALGPTAGIRDTRRVVDAMLADVAREGAGEYVDSVAARKAIGSATAALYAQRCARGAS